MIKISFTKNKLSAIGHANSDKKGKDLVCCAISTIFYSSLAWFKENEIDFKQSKKDNSLTISLIKKTKSNQDLLNLMFKQLNLIQKNYPKYIKIKKI